jgi:hypothetical protein
MTAHLEGREEEAVQEAEQVENAGGEPAHAEVAGDVTVAQLDAVAEKVWDVIARWSDVYGGVANLRDVEDEQRRLRWEFDKLPERAQIGLPLVGELANASDRFFSAGEPDDVESDIREELRFPRSVMPRPSCGGSGVVMSHALCISTSVVRPWQ